MALDADLILRVAREFHGRTDIDEEALKETAQRVSAFLGKARLADERALMPVGPAFSFNPAGEPYRTPPVVGEAAWSRIAGAGGGSGYGGATGTTGVREAPAVPPAPEGAAGPEYLWWPAGKLAAAVRRRDISPVELIRAALERLQATQPRLNAFVTVLAETALADAHRAEAEAVRAGGGPGGTAPAPGILGALHGVPIALKDIYETAGVRTTAGSRLLADYVPTHDATAVTRLRQSGAIILGKTATHEFAFGATSDSPYHGPVRNPWNPRMIPAGSSGGSGAAVAAGVVAIAMGTDTGGSIRMPAAHCGVVGLKPTYGRVSKAGVLPLSWSLDHVGPLCRSVADAALVLGLIAGPDPADPTALPVPLDDYVAASAAPDSLKGVRIGIPAAWLEGPVDPEVLARFREAVARLHDLGADVVDVVIPGADVMTFVNRLITLGEAGAYHAPFMRDRADEYAPDVRLRMELGQFVSARDYLVGQRLRGELAREVSQVMAGVDALATPTMPIPPAAIGQAMWEYPNGYREPVVEAMVRFPSPFSVTGQPAFSLPAGFTAAGLPVGIQLVGRPFGEAALIRIAAAYEAALGPQPRPGRE